MRNSIFLLAFCTSLEVQTTINLTVYATSAFYKHSLVATVYVVQSVVNGKPVPACQNVPFLPKRPQPLSSHLWRR